MSANSGPPARCTNPSCGYLFTASGIFGGGLGLSIQLIGNGTNCPRCGSIARVGDGLYEFSQNGLSLKEGPALTKEMIARLSAIAQSAKSKAIEAEELLTEVAEVSPDLAEKLRSKGLLPFVLILILIWLIKSVELNITVDVNRLIDQAQGVVASNPDPSVFDTPPPIFEAEPSEPPPSTLAAQSAAPVSRQVRRQLQRQAKKQARRDARNA